MRRASKRLAPWGIAVSLAAGITVVLAAPASAQTAPSPAPNPLSQLLQPLLQPLAPPGSSGGSGAGSAKPVPGPGPGNGASAAAHAPLPTNIEAKCGPTPAPLVFNRTPGRTTQQLLVEAARDAPPGTTVQQELVKIAAPFPLAGPAHYQDDWGAARTTPCPHLHQGNDIFAPAGTPVVAPENGILVREDSEAVGGLSFYLAGDDGYSFYGAHMSGFAPGLYAGERVTKGTVLGYVGNTGDAAGGPTHLHFELFAPGKAWSAPEDPKFWLDNALNTAIVAAGGTPDFGPDSDLAQSAPMAAQVNPGSFLSSVELAGGHIISQPTVPVLLLVVLVIGTLVVVQSRTFRVAAELRRSRSGAGGGEMIAADGFLASGLRRRERAGPQPGEPPSGPRPPWAALAEEVARPAPRPGLFARAKERLPETLNKVTAIPDRALDRTRASSPASFTASGSNGSRPAGSAGNGAGWSPQGAAPTALLDREPKKRATMSWSPPGGPGARERKRISGSRFSSIH
jgi:murein DD-endopeptidase MepM/ murein hydrolase activator NlpD